MRRSDRGHMPGEVLRLALDRAREARGCVMAPGAFCALCALAIRDAGFEACYVSGAATSVMAGVPDVGILTLDHFARLIGEISVASGLPVLADADTGFGEGEMVRRTVFDYHKAGAAGLHLEDQVFPKRCGHLDGKALIPLDHACEKVDAAARASVNCSDGTFVVCARTDARGVSGLDDAIARARAYVDAGADMIFPEGLQSREEFAAFSRAMDTLDDRRPYLLANMTEFGKTPMLRADEFAAMGYELVIFPVTLLRTAMGAVTRALRELKDKGTVASLLPQMQTRQELYKLIGYEPGIEWEYGRREK